MTTRLSEKDVQDLLKKQTQRKTGKRERLAGSIREGRVQEELERQGYYVIKSSGSHKLFDMIAFPLGKFNTNAGLIPILTSRQIFQDKIRIIQVGKWKTYIDAGKIREVDEQFNKLLCKDNCTGEVWFVVPNRPIADTLIVPLPFNESEYRETQARYRYTYANKT